MSYKAIRECRMCGVTCMYVMLCVMSCIVRLEGDSRNKTTKIYLKNKIKWNDGVFWWDVICVLIILKIQPFYNGQEWLITCIIPCNHHKENLIAQDLTHEIFKKTLHRWLRKFINSKINTMIRTYNLLIALSIAFFNQYMIFRLFRSYVPNCEINCTKKNLMYLKNQKNYPNTNQYEINLQTRS